MTNLVGEENGGWKLVTNQLNHERVALVSAATDLPGPARGSRVGAEHQGLPRRAAHRLGVGAAQPGPGARQGRGAQADQLGAGLGGRVRPCRPADASAAKVFGTELATEAYRLLMEVLGTAATLAARTRRARCCAAGSSGCTAPA